MPQACHSGAPANPSLQTFQVLLGCMHQILAVTDSSTQHLFEPSVAMQEEEEEESEEEADDEDDEEEVQQTLALTSAQHQPLRIKVPVHAHVLRHPYLESIGLVVDPALSCLCCESCKVALVPNHVDTHVKKIHGCDFYRIDNNLLAEACQRLGASSELPCMKGPGIKQQCAGLTLYDGIGCTLCHYACLSRETMRKHFQHSHPKSRPASLWPQVLVQQLDKQKSNMFFRVEPWNKPKAMPDDIYLKNVEESLEADRTEKGKEAETNARQISPWLLTTRWHEHFAGYDPEELRQLVAKPKKDEFPGLHNVVNNLFKLGLEIMDNCPELVLQRLNTPDPAKTYVDTNTQVYLFFC